MELKRTQDNSIELKGTQENSKPFNRIEQTDWILTEVILHHVRYITNL